MSTIINILIMIITMTQSYTRVWLAMVGGDAQMCTHSVFGYVERHGTARRRAAQHCAAAIYTYVYVYIYIYVYVYTYTDISLYLSTYIYIYT